MPEFVPRSQQEITDALLAYRTSDPEVSAALLPSDLNVGSLNRADIESVALLLEENDQRFRMGLIYAISESCYRAFGFERLPARFAVAGEVFSSYSPAAARIPIPIGTQLLGPGGVIFETTAAGAIEVGELSSATIPIKATTAGVIGNVAEDSIRQLVTPIAGVDMVTNPSKALGGFPVETDDARAERFAAFLRTLVRGTKEALEFAALAASSAITDARAIEPFLLDPRPEGVPYSGLVWLFCDDGTDSATLDAGVQNEVTKLVEGYVDGSGVVVEGFKAAGVRVEVRKVTRVPVYLRAEIRLKSGGVSRWAEVQENLTAAAATFFDQLRIGEKLSYQNLVAALSGADADLDEVDLGFWREGGAIPQYGAPLSAEDLSFFDPLTSSSAGARGVLRVGSAPGLSGNVSYPEWRLV